MGDQPHYKGMWPREESLLPRSEHHPALCEALRGVAVLVPSPISLCPGNKGSKKKKQQPERAGERQVGTSQFLGDSSLKHHPKVWKYHMSSGSLKVSAWTPLLPVLLLLLEDDACSLAALEVWNLFIPCWSERRTVWNVTLFYIYIFLVNSVVLMSAFGC